LRLAFIKKKFSIHGGAERYLQTLVGRLTQAGHEIHLFADRWTEETNVIFHKVAAVPFASFLSVLTFNRNAAKAIATASGFDHVISFERTTCQDIYRAGEGCHAEWLRIRSEIEPSYKRMSFRVNPLHRVLLSIERRLFAETRLIIANSCMVKDQIRNHYGVREERMAVIYNGVDLERFSPRNTKWRDTVRRGLGIPEGSRLLLFVGSGFERKGLGVLVKALSLLKGEDIRAVVIGKGDESRYRDLARQYGVPGGLTFLGARQDIEQFYAAADLFVLPTFYDPFSNATLEAMASGLPVITTRNNGVAELIEEGREGHVLEKLPDPRELADRICLSAGDLKSMGERARKKAEGFSIERAVGEFTEVIRKEDNT
jgi:UDP-glucose:(heptosyl)LPS alpha-1,3-glucosyltransferase